MQVGGTDIEIRLWLVKLTDGGKHENWVKTEDQTGATFTPYTHNGLVCAWVIINNIFTESLTESQDSNWIPPIIQQRECHLTFHLNEILFGIALANCTKA